MLAALMALLLAVMPLAACAQEADVTALMRAQVEEAIAALQADAANWTAAILAHAQITDVALNEKGTTVTATVTLPRLKCGVTSKDKVEDPAAFLSAAVAPYLVPSDTVTYTISAKVSEGEDGAVTLRWGSDSPTKLNASAKKLATAAKSTYSFTKLRQALEQVLLPRAITLPKTKPDEAPAFTPLADYGAAVATALGVTPECAARRLTPLMFLTETTKMDVSASLEAVVLTVRAKDWQTMLASAEAQAMTTLESMLGAPELTADELDRVLCDQMAQTFVDSVYTKSGITTEKLTLSLVDVAQQGPAGASGLMDFFRGYMAQVDDSVDRLLAYARTLPYYPEIPLIDTCVLTGASDTAGSRVTFDLGEDTVNHAYILVERAGQQVLSGFVHQGVRLAVRLTPGTYRVYFSVGPEWYGENYFFGAEARSGCFDITIGDEANTRVHLSAQEDAALTITDISWDDLRQEAGVR